MLTSKLYLGRRAFIDKLVLSHQSIAGLSTHRNRVRSEAQPGFQ